MFNADESRAELDQLNVKGFEGATAADLADNVQAFFHEYRGKNHVNIAERYFWQPTFAGDLHSALIFYTLSELPEQPQEDADDNTADDEE